jgi:hypothetical protein
VRYYRQRWDESRGDRHDAWGGSDWYFEVDDDGNVIRQVEVYDHGPRLRYGPDHEEGGEGALSEVPLPHDEWEPYLLQPDEFEAVWERT